jgi:hypothetical protein
VPAWRGEIRWALFDATFGVNSAAARLTPVWLPRLFWRGKLAGKARGAVCLCAASENSKHGVGPRRRRQSLPEIRARSCAKPSDPEFERPIMPEPTRNPPPDPSRPWLAKLPAEPWWSRYEFLAPLGEPWQPVSKPALIAWLIVYALYLIYAARAHGWSLFMDLVFLPIHEGGHLLFGYLGNQTLAVMGGTFLQLFVPLALAVYFVFQRHATGTAFAAFFFFENFLNVGTYMADARAQALPLVNVGGEGIHDWAYLFIKFGLINQAITIGNATRALGWLGMLAVVGWLAWRGKSVKS